MSLALASRYARAVADIAFDPKNQADPDALARELTLLVAQLEASRPLADTLASPAVTHARKRSVAAKVADRLGVSTIARQFLFVVIEHGRTSLLRTIRDSYLKIIDERRGIVQAAIVSAVDLNEDQRRELGGKLAEMTGKQVRCDFATDPAILGGAIVRIGSEVYDGSVRGKLRGIEKQLTRPV